jgi:hypothetical protein
MCAGGNHRLAGTTVYAPIVLPTSRPKGLETLCGEVILELLHFFFLGFLTEVRTLPKSDETAMYPRLAL